MLTSKQFQWHEKEIRKGKQACAFSYDQECFTEALISRLIGKVLSQYACSAIDLTTAWTAIFLSPCLSGPGSPYCRDSGTTGPVIPAIFIFYPAKPRIYYFSCLLALRVPLAADSLNLNSVLVAKSQRQVQVRQVHPHLSC